MQKVRENQRCLKLWFLTFFVIILSSILCTTLLGDDSVSFYNASGIRNSCGRSRSHFIFKNARIGRSIDPCTDRRAAVTGVKNPGNRFHGRLFVHGMRKFRRKVSVIVRRDNGGGLVESRSGSKSYSARSRNSARSGWKGILACSDFLRLHYGLHFPFLNSLSFSGNDRLNFHFKALF